MANVRARVLLKTRVSIINDHSGPKEGKQWHDIHHCVTKVIDLNEWKWRFATAKAILCGGTAPYGTSYGGAIGLYLLAYNSRNPDMVDV
jgi:hypothetical protein